MEIASNSTKEDEIPVPKSYKKSIQSTIQHAKISKSHLPDKDQNFVKEILKQPNLKIHGDHRSPLKSILSEGSKKLRGISLKPERRKPEKKVPKCSTSSEIKSCENLHDLNALSRLPATILASTNAIVRSNILDTSYKFFVGKGNNDTLVRKLLTDRPGWVKTFSPNSANLIWTEVKQTTMFDLIPSLTDSRKKKPETVPNKALAPTNPQNALTADPLAVKIYNKIECNKELSSKKRLFLNMSSYYKSLGENPFKYLPLSFHIVDGIRDSNFKDFIKHFRDFQKELPNDRFLNNCWIVKPGESTNRGIGITVCSTIDEVSRCVEDRKAVGTNQRTYIVQKYIYKPMLYRNRKFDIRCYVLVTVINNRLQAYFYREGYLRTSVSEFDMDNIKDRFIHLTNDAVQKNSPEYGKFEDGNKLSYQEFQEYIDECVENKVDFKDVVHPKMRKIVIDTIKATYKKLDPKRRVNSFEVLGYDFMLDEMFTPWLLEINTNPCLALSGNYLASLIPTMLTNAFAIALDQTFPINQIGEFEEKNNFELVFTYNRS